MKTNLICLITFSIVILGFCTPISAFNISFNQTHDLFNFTDSYKHYVMHVGEPSVMTDPYNSSQMILWYGNGTDNKIHYAYSSDGFNWSSNATNLPAHILRRSVYFENGVYYLYGTISDTEIKLYNSTNLYDFVDRGITIGLGASGEWDSRNVANTFVWKENDTYYMLYEGGSNDPWKIGLATSNDIKSNVWYKYAHNPVFSDIPNSGNPELMRNPDNSVYKNNDNYYMYYHNLSATNGETKIASSTNLTSWKMIGTIVHGGNTIAGYTYGDATVLQFHNGKTYLINNPSNQIDDSWLDVSVSSAKPIETKQKQQVWDAAHNIEVVKPVPVKEQSLFGLFYDIFVSIHF